MQEMLDILQKQKGIDKRRRKGEADASETNVGDRKDVSILSSRKLTHREQVWATWTSEALSNLIVFTSESAIRVSSDEFSLFCFLRDRDGHSIPVAGLADPSLNPALNRLPDPRSIARLEIIPVDLSTISIKKRAVWPTRKKRGRIQIDKQSR
jgi:hypothetical protein